MACCRGPGDIKTKAQTSGEGGGRFRKYLEGKQRGVRWTGRGSQEESRTVRGDCFSCPETGTHRGKGCWPGRWCIRFLGLPRQSPTDWGLKQQIYCPIPGGWKSEMEVSAGGFPRGLRGRISSPSSLPLLEISRPSLGILGLEKHHPHLSFHLHRSFSLCASLSPDVPF